MKTNEKITKELGFAILEAAGWEKVSFQLMFANGHQEI